MTLFLPSRVINTCTVRDKSVNSFQSLYDEAKRSGKTVVIAGCMTEADRDMKKRFTQDSIVGVTEIGSIKEVVDAALTHHPVHTQKQDTLPPLDLPKIRKDPSVGSFPSLWDATAPARSVRRSWLAAICGATKSLKF